jgi:multidrug efflux pump subunit AcrB
MILLFLGSWRSTVIVAVSIPLSILVSIIVLKLFGMTLNLMTLGGMALAVGMLVDDSTVEIENIHRNLHQGKEINHAILDGAAQIAVPAFVSTLAICIVFAPVFFLSGAARSLFVPLAMAVVFAMMASYLISRTLVPTLVKYLLRSEVELYQGHHSGRGLIWRTHDAFNRVFEAFRDRYRGLLVWSLDHRAFVMGVFLLVPVASIPLVHFAGQDFFPEVDTGQLRLHVRAPSGTRLEATELFVQEIGDELRRMIPPGDLHSVLDNIGMATSGSTIAYADPATIGSADAEILVSLTPHRKGSTLGYMKEIRKTLPSKFPGLVFFFEPPDMVSQILNFGLPAPIDIQVVGRSPLNYEVAQEIQRRVAKIPGAVDVHLHQPLDVPEFRVNVDRTKASELGLTQNDVASSVLVSLSGTAQVAPNYWLNPRNGVNYRVIVQTPQHALDSIEKLGSTPIQARNGRDLQLLGNLATAERRSGAAVVNHYNVQPVVDIYAAVEGRDLAGVSREVDRIIEQIRPTLPRGTTIQVRGQVESMKNSFTGLAGGLVIAILLVYFLMVVNFQSWLDPFIIAMALPGALAGILWMLCLTHTTLNVPSLMGAIMAMGVATANSILMITFANDRRKEGADARTAALDAGTTRLRPVLMTAFAMIIGMLPMSLGLGEGGEQNAPLGRAVIGGLIFATVSTLFFVPLVYSALRRKAPAAPEVLPS